MRSQGDAERGSAVVEFTLVSVVLLTLFLAILQVGVVLHVRNTLIASAAEGARYAANADRSPDDGAARAAELIASAVSPAYAEQVTAGYDTVDGVQTVYVRVRAAMPVAGLVGVPGWLDVRGHAVDETPAG